MDACCFFANFEAMCDFSGILVAFNYDCAKSIHVLGGVQPLFKTLNLSFVFSFLSFFEFHLT